MKKGFNAADRVLLFAFLGFLAAWGIKCLYPFSLGASLLLTVAEASLVGGVADWFAVTALFSRPLGFPWHTAILPAHREEFTAATIRLIQREFLSPRKLFALLGTRGWQISLIEKICDEKMRANFNLTLVRLLAQALGSLDLKVAENAVAQSIRRELWQISAEKAVSAIKENLEESGGYALFAALGDGALNFVAAPDFLPNLADRLRQLVETKTAKPLFAIFAGLAEMSGIVDYHEAASLIKSHLEKTAKEIATPDSPTQKIFRSRLLAAIDHVGNSQEFQRDFSRYSDEVISRLPIEAAVEKVFQDFGEEIDELGQFDQNDIAQILAASGETLPFDATRKDDALVPYDSIATILARLAPSIVAVFLAALKEAPETGRLFSDMAGRTVLKAREMAGQVARNAMERMSDDDLNAIIYDKVEPDLLWIRMNGSIVGAAIGLGMFIILEMIPKAFGLI